MNHKYWKIVKLWKSIWKLRQNNFTFNFLRSVWNKQISVFPFSFYGQIYVSDIHYFFYLAYCLINIIDGTTAIILVFITKLSKFSILTMQLCKTFAAIYNLNLLCMWHKHTTMLSCNLIVSGVFKFQQFNLFAHRYERIVGV